MAFLEQRISDAVMRGSRGGPRASRRKAYLPGGRMQQSFLRTRALHGYDLSYGIRTAADFEEIRAFFYVVMFTPYEGFRARDWNDYLLTQANSTLTFISGSTWQIGRVYSVGAVDFVRTITKIAGTPVIKRDRGGAITTASATVDPDTGIATISGHVGGDTYTCEGEFDVPVTFEDDVLDQIELDGTVDLPLQALPSIRLEELAP